ncbi:MAG: hypothetical protein ACFFBH_09830 [Promethearchaeota archaeon]
MISGRILENYQMRIINYSESTPIDLNLIINPRKVEINLESIMDKIWSIHWLLKINSQFSNELKLDYCKIERTLMIEFLKMLVDRY